MNSGIADFMLGLGMGVLLATGLFVIVDDVSGNYTMRKHVTSVIEKCEAELPRNKKCKIIAVAEAEAEVPRHGTTKE